LSERIALLRHADFFIGLSSGLAWLAWSCRIPVILISGFSLPICEFHTPYRVYSTHGCAGCWDEIAVNFDHRDFFWCPHHKGTERQYECTRLITGKQVIGHIDRLMRDHGLEAPKERKDGVSPPSSVQSSLPDGVGELVMTTVAEARRLSDQRAELVTAALVAADRYVEQVWEMLEDEASREQYRRELRFMVLRGLLRDDTTTLRLAGNVSPETWNAALGRVESLRASGEIPDLQFAPSADWVIPWMYASLFVLEQYRYEGAVDIHEGDVFLDCGGCCGETAVWAVTRGAGRVFTFEPNPEAHPYLNANVENYGHDRITLVSAGVGATSRRMNMVMEAGNIGGTRLVEDANGSVSVVALDDWCRENAVRPDFIKMDIEGAEPEALQGARQVITKYRPRLAICLYHRFSDMWEIPRLLHEMVPEYRFWCRKNAPFVEFVLYASV
jgi:FkbM family methyltransferase